MVSGLEWSVIALILFGMVIPFWLLVFITVAAFRAIKREPSDGRADKYARLMRELSDVLSKESYKFNGPALIACLRDLKNFPEYRDASILFLDSISVTGKSKFDEMARTEIKAVDAYLLGLKDE